MNKTIDYYKVESENRIQQADSYAHGGETSLRQGSIFAIIGLINALLWIGEALWAIAGEIRQQRTGQNYDL